MQKIGVMLTYVSYFFYYYNFVYTVRLHGEKKWEASYVLKEKFPYFYCMCGVSLPFSCVFYFVYVYFSAFFAWFFVVNIGIFIIKKYTYILRSMFDYFLTLIGIFASKVYLYFKYASFLSSYWTFCRECIVQIFRNLVLDFL